MKRYKKLIILAVVLCVAAGCYFIVKYAVKTDSSGDAVIYSEDGADITSVTLSHSGDSYTLEKDSESKWTVSGESDFDIDTDTVDSLISAFSNFKVSQKISDEFTDSDKYGLGDSALIITVKTSNDNDRVIRVGKLNENSSMYYLSQDSDSALYYIDSSLYKTINLSKLDIVKRDKIPDVNYDDVKLLKIANGDFLLSIVPTATETESESGASEYVISGTSTKIDKDTAEKLFDSPLSADVTELVCYKPDEDAMKQYGLDSPYGSYSIEYTKAGQAKTFSIIVSKADSDSNVFFMISGSDKIYKMPSADLSVYSIDSLSKITES